MLNLIYYLFMLIYDLASFIKIISLDLSKDFDTVMTYFVVNIHWLHCDNRSKNDDLMSDEIRFLISLLITVMISNCQNVSLSML